MTVTQTAGVLGVGYEGREIANFVADLVERQVSCQDNSSCRSGRMAHLASGVLCPPTDRAEQCGDHEHRCAAQHRPKHVARTSAESEADLT
jgi:hypothetical protein